MLKVDYDEKNNEFPSMLSGYIQYYDLIRSYVVLRHRCFYVVVFCCMVVTYLTNVDLSLSLRLTL